MTVLQDDAMVYSKNQNFLAKLRSFYRHGMITKQELMTLRGQALSGDSDGASRGLAKLITGRDGYERTMF